MKKLFTADEALLATLEEDAYWFIIYNDQLLMQQNAKRINLPRLLEPRDCGLDVKQALYIGTHKKYPCYSVLLEQTMSELPPNFLWVPLRQAYKALLDSSLFLLLTRAKQLHSWDTNSQFCGCCGGKNEESKLEVAKICGSCGHISYPQIAPVMLALVWRPKEILLARSPHFSPNVYSILAGFVEAGENLEDCVVREIQEEVGLSVKNLQYFGSQPWPFPNNLMLGFFAEYEAGEIKIDPTEIEDAQWYSIDNLPKLPEAISLSRAMIDSYLARS